MKRFVLMLLAFTMLFVMASAEESFVEEDFVTAAVFDDEFFAEETFFGDEFEAEQPEVEDLRRTGSDTWWQSCPKL